MYCSLQLPSCWGDAVCLGGVHPHCILRYTHPCAQNDWQTGVKTLPCAKLRLRAVNFHTAVEESLEGKESYIKISHPAPRPVARMGSNLIRQLYCSLYHSQSSCNVNISTQYHTTHLFPFPVSVPVPLSVNTPSHIKYCLQYSKYYFVLVFQVHVGSGGRPVLHTVRRVYLHAGVSAVAHHAGRGWGGQTGKCSHQ